MIVSGHVVEKEVFFDQLICLLLVDEILVSWGQAVILTGKTELLENINEGIFEFNSFLFAHFWWKIPSCYISSDSCSHRNLFQIWIDISQQILTNWDVPIVFLFGVSFDFVVFLDQWLKIESISIVVLRSGGVGSDTAVIIFQTSHHNVKNSLLIFLLQGFSLLSCLRGPEFVGQGSLDSFKFSPLSIDFAPVDVALCIQIIFSAVFQINDHD